MRFPKTSRFRLARKRTLRPSAGLGFLAAPETRGRTVATACRKATRSVGVLRRAGQDGRQAGAVAVYGLIKLGYVGGIGLIAGAGVQKL